MVVVADRHGGGGERSAAAHRRTEPTMTPEALNTDSLEEMVAVTVDRLLRQPPENIQAMTETMRRQKELKTITAEAALGIAGIAYTKEYLRKFWRLLKSAFHPDKTSTVYTPETIDRWKMDGSEERAETVAAIQKALNGFIDDAYTILKDGPHNGEAAAAAADPPPPPARVHNAHGRLYPSPGRAFLQEKLNRYGNRTETRLNMMSYLAQRLRERCDWHWERTKQPLRVLLIGEGLVAMCSGFGDQRMDATRLVVDYTHWPLNDDEIYRVKNVDSPCRGLAINPSDDYIGSLLTRLKNDQTTNEWDVIVDVRWWVYQKKQRPTTAYNQEYRNITHYEDLDATYGVNLGYLL